MGDLTDELTKAYRRQRVHQQEAHSVDRTSWTTEQWCDDAERLMGDGDGAVTSLLNGHVMALLRERKQHADALTAAEARIAAAKAIHEPQRLPDEDVPYCKHCGVWVQHPCPTVRALNEENTDECPQCGGTGEELPDGNVGFDDPGALLSIPCRACGGHR